MMDLQQIKQIAPVIQTRRLRVTAEMEIRLRDLPKAMIEYEVVPDDLPDELGSMSDVRAFMRLQQRILAAVLQAPDLLDAALKYQASVDAGEALAEALDRGADHLSPKAILLTLAPHLPPDDMAVLARSKGYEYLQYALIDSVEARVCGMQVTDAAAPRSPDARLLDRLVTAWPRLVPEQRDQLVAMLDRFESY